MYDIIAENYSDIFPLDANRVDFTESLIGKKSASILDVGCATGDLSVALAKRGHNVLGIDLNQKMIEIAKKRPEAHRENLRFLTMDMMDIDGLGCFDIVLCFGNTLPHLPSLEEVRAFFKKVYNALKENSPFVLQVLNYNKVFQEGKKDFPVVDKEEFAFNRKCSSISSDSLIFNISVIDKNTGQRYTEKTRLFPIVYDDIVETLKNVGFAEVRTYKDYAKNASDFHEFATLYVANKNL